MESCWLVGRLIEDAPRTPRRRRQIVAEILLIFFLLDARCNWLHMGSYSPINTKMGKSKFIIHLQLSPRIIDLHLFPRKKAN